MEKVREAILFSADLPRGHDASASIPPLGIFLIEGGKPMTELERLEKIAAKCVAKSAMARAQRNHRRARAWYRARQVYARKAVVETAIKETGGTKT